MSTYFSLGLFSKITQTPTRISTTPNTVQGTSNVKLFLYKIIGLFFYLIQYLLIYLYLIDDKSKPRYPIVFNRALKTRINSLLII